MKNKIISIALVLGILLSLLSSVPVSADAASNRSLSYAFFDYEDGVANLQDATIVDGGMAGSAKSLKYTTSATTYEDKALTIDGTNPVTGTVPVNATLKVSFNLKISRPLTAGNLGLKLSNGEIVAATFDPANTDWQKVTFSKLVSEELALTSLAIRFGSLSNGGNVAVETQHTYYIDDMEFSYAVVPGTAPMSLDNYNMDFENGSSFLISSTTQRGTHITATEWSNGSYAKAQLIPDPLNSSNTVMKIWFASTVTGEGWHNNSQAKGLIQIAKSITSTDTAEGIVGPGETLKVTFRYYLPQAVASSNNPSFTIGCQKNGAGATITTSTNPSTTAFVWNTVELTYTNSTASNVTVKMGDLRLLGANSYARSWMLPDGTTNFNFGDRAMYIDDFKVTIGSGSSEGGSGDEGPVKPESSALAFAGTFAKGQQVTFSHTFSPATEGATDNSLVRLVATKDGKSASLGSCAVAGGSLTVPVIPEGASLKFEVVPKDSNGAVGDVVTYDYATVVGSYGATIDSLTFSPEGDVTAAVTVTNERVDQTTIKAILIVLMYDADDAVIGYNTKPIVCAYNATITGTDGECTVEANASAASAQAFLWYCEGEDTPSLSNTTMEQFAPSVSVTR